MNEVTTVGIDLAKNVFSLHGVDAAGVVVVRKSVSRAKLAQLVAQLPPCLIGMEACSGAHEWARRFAQFGHTVKLMAGQFVTAYRHSGKNDSNDAQAICEAVSRPSMRFVPVKSREQQGQLCLHRVRSGFVEERTATLNRLRGLLSEFGVVLPLGANALRTQAWQLLEQLPDMAAAACGDLLEHVRVLDARIVEYERRIKAHVSSSPLAQRAQTQMGVGPLSASAIVASVADARAFKNGRQFAAWLGLVPRQHSTGGKSRLGNITRSGDRYIRTLLVLGARSVLTRAAHQSDPLSRWAHALRLRRGYYRACVAIAAKNARRVWAVLNGRTERRLPEQRRARLTRLIEQEPLHCCDELSNRSDRRSPNLNVPPAANAEPGTRCERAANTSGPGRHRALNQGRLERRSLSFLLADLASTYDPEAGNTLLTRRGSP